MATTAQESTLPDINAETYPFEVVQSLLDQAAHFVFYSEPEPQASGRAILSPDQGRQVIGFRMHESLRRMRGGAVGEIYARFEQRWMMIPWEHQAQPGQEPPATPLDMSRSQRFVMLDGICRFGNGEDGFRGFGTGTTFPVTEGEDGRRVLLAAAVGNVTEGFGRLRDLVGTYTYCGCLSPEGGFRGTLLVRLLDPAGRLGSEGDLPPLETVPDPEPGITWLLFRGQKRGRNQRTEYRLGADGQVIGLDVEQDLRTIELDAADRGHRGLQAVRQIGPVIGRMTARIDFNLFSPGAPGTARAPIPFKSYNEYAFFGPGGRTVGTLNADGSEGRTFLLDLPAAPGQRALRFAGFGPIVQGTGAFEGIRGLMTDNSVVGIAPHAISTLYILRLDDPSGELRAAFDRLGRLG